MASLPLPRADGAHDFDFLFGDWTVHHRKLRRRLAGDTTWDTFDGTCSARPLLGGRGNVDDNVLGGPGAPYRAATVRRYDASTGQWSIWWLADRYGTIDAPMVGGFEDGVGRFFADEAIDGRMVRVRFVWSDIARDGLRWEQAFSIDGGTTWEVNWEMSFERTA